MPDRALGSKTRNIKRATTPESIPESFQSELYKRAPSRNKTSQIHVASNIVSRDDELSGTSTTAGQVREMDNNPSSSVPKARVPPSSATHSDQQSSAKEQVSGEHPVVPLAQSKPAYSPDKFPASYINDSSPIPISSRFDNAPSSEKYERSDQIVTGTPSKSTHFGTRPEPGSPQTPASNNEGENLLLPSRNLNHTEKGLRHSADDDDNKAVMPKEQKPLNTIVSPEQKDRSHLKDNFQDVNYLSLPHATHADKFATAMVASYEKPEETTVTVNIGRIEIRSASEGNGGRTHAHPLKKEFSPTLSLADYLKQRAERKA